MIKQEAAVQAYMKSEQFSKDPAKRGLSSDYVNGDNSPSISAAMDHLTVPAAPSEYFHRA